MTNEERDRLFEDLYKRYYSDVIAFLRRFRFSGERTHELAQDTFVRVFKAMDTFRGDEGGWWSFIREAAFNTALNEIRAQKTQKRQIREVSFEELSYPWEGSEPPSQQERLIKTEERERRKLWLKGAIKDLPQGARECLLLWLAGCSYKEIETALGITMDAVKSRLHDARKRLQEKASGERS